MPWLYSYLFLLSFLSWSPTAQAKKPPDCLRTCWQQLVRPLRTGYLVFHYQETVQELEHNAVPWQTTAYAGHGTVWANATTFLKQDTLTASATQRAYFSSTQWSTAGLLYRDYGDKNFFAATQGLQQDYLFRAARYAPLNLIAYFYQHQVAADTAAAVGVVTYQTTINQTRVRLLIRAQDGQLQQVQLLSPDELFGDVTTTFSYTAYAHLGKLAYPTHVLVEKANGQVHEEIRVRTGALQATVPVLLTAPAGYQLLSDRIVPPVVEVETYRPHVHFVALPHTDDRALVVEFDHFLLVAEAPLSSENGELIIQAAQKLAPGKPIRYFVAGHHHPHYLGGVRPFVYRGATVLVGSGDAAYVRYLATAPHTLHPDSLQRHPRPVQVEEITHARTIADAHFTMQIFCIGAQSAHTNDYLIYYFPSEKLLFEDDLVSVPQQGPIRKANVRQAGLYQAIQSLHLNVTTVVQSWPVSQSGLKTIIPFTDLEQSVK